MKQFLIEFEAEYYCQGYEKYIFQRLVTASTFNNACIKLESIDNAEWEKGSPCKFKNLTI